MTKSLSAQIGWSEGLLRMVKEKDRRIIFKGFITFAVDSTATLGDIKSVKYIFGECSIVSYDKEIQQFSWENIEVIKETITE